MLKETVGNTPAGTNLPPLHGLAARFETPIRRLAHTIMDPMFRSGANMIEYEHLEESLSELSNLLNENSLLVIVTSHNSHSDILVGIKLVQAIRSGFPQVGNFYIPVAASLMKGQQGLVAQLFYSEGTLPFLKQQNINPFPAVTENDRIKRHLKPSLSDIKHDIKQLNRAAAEKESAFLVFPEGSVEAGRYDALGNMKGMQKVTNPFLPHIFQKAHEADKKVIILPVGISGTNKMISAESLFLTWLSTGALIQNWIFRRSPPLLATAIVGHPYEYPNQPGKNLTTRSEIVEVNKTVMDSIADLKPGSEKGHYGSTATQEYQQDMKTYEEWRPFLVAPWRILFRKLPSA